MQDHRKPIYKHISILFVSIITALSVAYYINPFDNVRLAKWDRSMSPAVLSGISIGKRISNIYLYNFIIIPILFIAIALFLLKISKNNDTFIRAIRNIEFVFMFSLGVAYMARFMHETEMSGIDNIAYNVLVSAMLGYLGAVLAGNILKLSNDLQYSDYVFLFVNHLYFVIACALPFDLEDKGKIFINIVASLFSLVSVYILNKSNGTKWKNVLLRQCEIAYYAIFLWVATVETFYMATHHGITIRRPTFILFVVMAIYFFICLAVGIILEKPYNMQENGFGKAYKDIRVNYFGVVLSTTIISIMGCQFQLNFDALNNARIFELENRAIALETFERAKLPVIDYFSGHALMDVLAPITYRVCGGDIQSALFLTPWGDLVYVLEVIMLFFILRQIFDKNWTILFVLIFPFVSNFIFWGELGFVAIVGMFGVIRNPQKYLYYIAFWISLILCVFSRYDSGISIAIGCIVTGLILAYLGKISFKKSVGSAVVVCVPCLISFIIYSTVRGFNWFQRVKEWIDVGAKSSATWATQTFGDINSIGFVIAYELFPLLDALMIFLTLYLLIKYRTSLAKGVLSLTFCVAYAFMITRTLVFHNLAVTNGSTGVVLNYFPLAVFFFTLFICDLLKPDNAKLVNGVPILMFFLTLEASVIMVGNIMPNAKSSVFVKGYSCSEAFDSRKLGLSGNEGHSRVVFSEYTNSFVENFENIFDLLLEKEQTFIDYANITSLYAFTGRECPSYVAQTPSLLSNEESQLFYLQEIEEADAPLAILGNEENSYLLTMDGVRHNVRYYKLAEHIFSQYRPLVLIGTEYAIWCKDEKYDEFMDKIVSANLDMNRYTLIDQGYDSEIQEYAVGDVPYIWANFDMKNAVDNEIIAVAKIENANLPENADVQYVFELPDGTDKAQGQYLYFECENMSDTNIMSKVILSDDSDWAYSYEFTVMPGNHKYLIRISSSDFWYQANIDTVTFCQTEIPVIYDQVRILQGD